MYRYAIAICTILTLQGCAQQPTQSELPLPEATIDASVLSQTKHPSPAQVAIFVSEDIPAYSDVAKSLGKLLGRKASIQYLGTSPLENLKTVAKFKNEANTQFVSIGLNAAIAAKSLNNNQVIFCQVYNYQDHALLSPRHKGISMLPSLPKTFSTWRALSPDITDIGIISGPGMDDVIQAARIAAQTNGIKLHHVSVNTDKEYQYAYKKLS